MKITLENLFNILVEDEFLFLCFYFSWNFKKRNHFPIRLILCIILAQIVPFLSQSIDTGNFIFSMTLNYIIVFLLGPLCLYFCFDYPFNSSMFLSVVSYSFRHTIYLLWQVIIEILEDSFFLDLSSFSWIWIVVTFPLVLPSIPIAIFLYLRIKKYPSVAVPSLNVILASSSAMLVTIILNNFILSFDFSKIDHTIHYILNIFALLCSFMIILILMGNVKEVSLKGEIVAINQLRHQEEKQYEISKESIDLINIKCHDLRHQIRQLNNQEKISREDLAEIENAIRIYDTKMKTGNSSMDVILQEKLLLCNKNNIASDFIIDGKQLSFMKESDIYSLFGNILDNAIDAVSRIPSPNKRTIALKVKRIAGGVFASAENPFQGEIQYKDGLPVTTKKDLRYHGFGMKSIRNIVNYYNGTLTITSDGRIYKISIFFPEKEEKSD